MLKGIIITLALIAAITGGYAIYSVFTTQPQNSTVATPDTPQSSETIETPSVTPAEPKAPETAPKAVESATTDKPAKTDLKTEIRARYLHQPLRADVEAQAWQCFNDTADFLLKAQQVKGTGSFGGWASRDDMLKLAEISATRMLNPCSGMTYSDGKPAMGLLNTFAQKEFGI